MGQQSDAGFELGLAALQAHANLAMIVAELAVENGAAWGNAVEFMERLITANEDLIESATARSFLRQKLDGHLYFFSRMQEESESGDK